MIRATPYEPNNDRIYFEEEKSNLSKESKVSEAKATAWKARLIACDFENFGPPSLFQIESAVFFDIYQKNTKSLLDDSSKKTSSCSELFFLNPSDKKQHYIDMRGRLGNPATMSHTDIEDIVPPYSNKLRFQTTDANYPSAIQERTQNWIDHLKSKGKTSPQTITKIKATAQLFTKLTFSKQTNLRAGTQCVIWDLHSFDKAVMDLIYGESKPCVSASLCLKDVWAHSNSKESAVTLKEPCIETFSLVDDERPVSTKWLPESETTGYRENTRKIKGLIRLDPELAVRAMALLEKGIAEKKVAEEVGNKALRDLEFCNVFAGHKQDADEQEREQMNFTQKRTF